MKPAKTNAFKKRTHNRPVPQSLRDNAFKPGHSGGPGRPQNVGLTILEKVNALSVRDLPEAELRRIAKDVRLGVTMRIAARRLLSAIEVGDLADYEDVIRGCSLKDLRDQGLNTELIKKIKAKVITSGEEGTILEREIELHDRSAQEFDRLLDRFVGKPKADEADKPAPQAIEIRIIGAAPSRTQ